MSVKENERRAATGRRSPGRWTQFKSAMKLWWTTPSVSKARWTTGITLSLCVFVVAARPVLDQVQPAGREATWAQILTTQAVATAVADTAALAAPATTSPAAPASIAPAAPKEVASTVTLPPAAPASIAPATVAAADPAASVPREVIGVAPGKSEAELFGDQLQALSSLYETLITVLAVGLGLLATAAFAAIRFASMREAESLAREVLRGVEYKSHVAALIKEQVESQLSQLNFDVRELQDALAALDEKGERKVAPEEPPPDAPPAATPPPTPPPAAAPPVAPSIQPGDQAPAEATPPPPVPPEPTAPAVSPDTAEPQSQESSPNPGNPQGTGA